MEKQQQDAGARKHKPSSRFVSPSSESQSLRHPAYSSSLNSLPHPLICCKNYHPKTVGRSQNEHVLGKLLLKDLEDQGATIP